MNIVAQVTSFLTRSKLALSALVLGFAPALALLPAGVAHAAPTVDLTSHSYLDVVSGTTVNLTATATNAVSVKFVMNGDLAQVISEDFTAPYTAVWDTTTVPEGEHLVGAIATDSFSAMAGDHETVVVDNYTDLVAAYGFNNNTSVYSRTGDGAGNNHSLTCGTNCPSYSSTGDRNGAGAYDFSGNDDWFTLSNESDFDFTTDMTVEYWFKVPTSTWSASWATMAAKGDTSWLTGRYTSYDTLGFSTYNGSTYIDNHAGLGEDLDDGTWHHAAYTYDGTNKKIYLDGALMTTYGYSQTLNNNNYGVSLGFNVEDNSGDFDGMLDDVRIYSRAISAGEVTQDMATPVINY